MTPKKLFEDFFSEGRSAFKIISLFFYTNKNVFEKSEFDQPDDLVHHVYNSLLNTSWENIRIIENYIHRSVKIQCWTVLSRVKKRSLLHERFSEEEYGSVPIKSAVASPSDEYDGNELFSIIHDFKKNQTELDQELLNLLIDDPEDSLIYFAAQKKQNVNAIRTRLHRIRKALAVVLHERGYFLK